MKGSRTPSWRRDCSATGRSRKRLLTTTVAARKAARVGGSAIYTGTVAMFTAAGSTEVARTYPTRPVMRLELRHPDHKN
ncbi:MAG TPA: hypothetical protein VFG00_09865 [Acidothermaceae bacterium]|nr:hypothetical protein [Acidothermaceae bacterium]